jgi:septal ring factor EnvC (AmiA/AmiB activator)
MFGEERAADLPGPPARVVRGPGARAGWIASGLAAGVGLLAVSYLYFGIVVPQSLHVATLQAELDRARADIAALQTTLEARGAEKSRLEAAAEALNTRVEQQQGEQEELKQRQDEIDASLRRKIDEEKKAASKKKRKKRR